MRRIAMIAWLSLTTMWLAACGGSACDVTGEGSGGCSSGTSGVSSISVSTSTATIAADGSTTATITAVAKNSSNVVVPGATITFTTTAGNLTVTSATTSSSGVATATLAAGSAASGTAITVTATDGGVKGTATITVASTQETITLTTSLPQILSDGSQTATLTALVKDANNNVVPGVTVAFTATSGALTVTQATTGAVASTTPGIALATLTPGGNPANRPIAVTATAGGATATVTIPVTGTTLTVTGSPTLVLNGTGTYTVALANSATTGIPNTAVTLTSALGNTLSPASVTTASTGLATFTVTAIKSGTDTVTATALGQSAKVSIAVSSQNFQFTTPSSSVTSTDVYLVGSTKSPTVQTLSVVWTVNGAPQIGQLITFAATRGTLSSSTATTDATGTATVTISSAVAGPAAVTASTAESAAVTSGSFASVSTQTNLEFISTTPAAIDLQASPATIVTQGQSTLTAVVRDVNNNVVEGQVVDFATVGDVTGGTLSVPSAVTDSEGRAQTVYTASTNTSATNGVVIEASIQNNSSISATADLTVGGLSASLVLGTTNLIAPTGCDTVTSICTQFELPYSVLVQDSAGHPVQNVTVALTIHALDYKKGAWTSNSSNTPPWSQGTPTTCPNEDASELGVVAADVYDGVLEAGEDGCQANASLGLAAITPSSIAPAVCNANGNRNGQLDPGATAVVSPGTVTTNATGTATFNVIYPQSIAAWVDVQLIATATVSGTEASKSVSFLLPMLASDLTSATVSPPGAISPYGQATSCSDPN